MKSAGVYTDDEIRDRTGYDSLTDDQRAHVVTDAQSGFPSTLEGVMSEQMAGQERANTTAKGGQTDDGTNNIASSGDRKQGEYPDTPHSSNTHTRDPSQNVIRGDTTGR